MSMNTLIITLKQDLLITLLLDSLNLDISINSLLDYIKVIYYSLPLVLK